MARRRQRAAVPHQGGCRSGRWGVRVLVGMHPPSAALVLPASRSACVSMSSITAPPPPSPTLPTLLLPPSPLIIMDAPGLALLIPILRSALEPVILMVCAAPTSLMH